MSLTGLAAAAAILAAVLAMAHFLSGPRRPVAAATRATKGWSGASPASGTTSGGSENAAVPLSATSGYDAGPPAGYQPVDGCGHSAVPSSHVDTGSSSDSGGCVSH